jgi:periplasmic mercuric ion binding protein
MKYIQLTILSIYLLFSSVHAQQQIKKVVISTPTVQCEKCKTRIENYVSREEGVKSVVVDIKKKTTTVTYVYDRIGIEEIKTAIANVGYDADNIPAEIDTYNKLPKCCRKTERKPLVDSLAH